MNVRLMSSILVALFLLATAAGCSTWRKLDRTERGAVIGAGSGALIGGSGGSASGALLGGAAGGVAGGVIGKHSDDD